MKYFHTCQTIEEVKKLYKQLAKDNHPDRGGDTATMQAINNEYAQAIRMVAAGNKMSAEQTESAIHESEVYAEAINKIINLEGINIEIVGHWIGVTGNTRAHKDILNSEPAKFFWASKKLAWYYRPAEWKSQNRQKMTFDEIRRKYGTQTITRKSYSSLTND